MTDEQPWDEKYQPYTERGEYFLPHPDGTYEVATQAEWEHWFERRDFDESPTGPGEDPRMRRRREERHARRAEFQPEWAAEQERLREERRRTFGERYPDIAARLADQSERAQQKASVRDAWTNVAFGLFAIAILAVVARAVWHLVT